jgi:uncharacterized membrane protein YkvI
MKKRETKKTLAAAGVFISLMVGAGFASGRELLTFFAKNGAFGVLGLVISCAILALCGWAVMDISHRRRISGYSDFMSLVLGKNFGRTMVFVVNIFIFVMMATMFSGFGEAMAQAVSLNYTVSVVFIASLCFLTFLFDLKGILRISTILAPILVVGGLFFGMHQVLTETAPAFLSFTPSSLGFLWPAVIYASYNLLTAVSVLSTMGDEIVSRRAALHSAAISGIVILLLGLAFLAPIYLNFSTLKDTPVPLLALAERGGGGIEAVYLVVLFAAIFTTAVSSGFAVIEWLYPLVRKKVSKLFVKIAVTVTGIALAHIGFSVFIERAYPLFGYIGIFQIAAILLFFAFNGKKIN